MIIALQSIYGLYTAGSKIGNTAVPVEPATKIAEDSGIRNLLAGFL